MKKKKKMRERGEDQDSKIQESIYREICTQVAFWVGSKFVLKSSKTFSVFRSYFCFLKLLFSPLFYLAYHWGR